MTHYQVRIRVDDLPGRDAAFTGLRREYLFCDRLAHRPLQRARVGNFARQGRRGDGECRGQEVAGLGMAVTTGEVACLRRDHDFVFRQRAHVECLIGARAGRENVRSCHVQGFEQAFLQRGKVDAPRGGHNL